MSSSAAAALAAKKKSFGASERNARRRTAFRHKVAAWDVTDFVFVDEMGINLALAREYGRAAPGERVVDTRPSARGHNVSVLGALGLDSLRAAMSVPGAVDGDAYLVFIQQVLAPRLRPGNIVFMDNIPTHKMSAVANALAAVGARPQFLPAYSPDFSPLENCWAKVKTRLRTAGARTQRALDWALSDALTSITTDDIKGWFAHCGYRDALN